MTELDAVLLYTSGETVQDVADKYGTSYSTMWRILKKHGALRGKKLSIKLSVESGRFTRNRKSRKGFVMAEETKQKISKAKKGKGRGWRVSSSGYIEYTTGENSGRSEHVVKMESHIGRKLYANECVHHKNHIKTDNRQSNLQLMTRSDHARLHAKENHSTRLRDEQGKFQ